MKTARFAAFELLLRMEEGAYSSILLGAYLSKNSFSQSDKKFLSRLFYGVIERKITLDYILAHYSKKPLSKLDTEVLIILRMGIYQLLYMDFVPDSAAVNESVKLIGQAKKSSAAGFVNGILRSFLRDGKKFSLPTDKFKRFSVEYSCGEDIVRLILENYPTDLGISLFESSFLPNDAVVRVNTLKISAEDLREKFAEIGVDAQLCDIPALSGECLCVSKDTSAVIASGLFQNGYFHVQDISSQLVCLALSPKPFETVVDVCAAPGGKTFTISQMMQNTGRVFSCELHKNRLKLIEDGAKRLGITNISTLCCDARDFNSDILPADRVLCDVPCSGLGTFRSKPEIKYKNTADFESLPDVQYQILENSSKYLKSGGTLVYSTCTVNPHENEDVVKRFLDNHQNFYPAPFLEDFGEPFGGSSAVIFPKYFGGDGFFISKMIKR